MAALVFPSNPINGQLYPDPSVSGVSSFRYDSGAGTWRPTGTTGVSTPSVTSTSGSYLCLSGVTPGTYTNATVTVNAQGLVTYAANGNLGTVSYVATGTGLAGGPITSSGTISLAVATTSALGGVKPDGTTITILPDGTISAPGTQNWTRTGTVLSPTVAGDQVQISISSSIITPGLSLVGKPTVGFGSLSAASENMFFAVNGTEYLNFSAGGLQLKSVNVQALRIGGVGNSPLDIQSVIVQPLFGGNQFFNIGFTTNPAPFGDETTVLSTYATGSGGRQSISFNANGSIGSGGFPDLIIGTDGNTRIPQRKALRFYDADSSNYVGFSAPAAVTSNVTWSLPPADGTSGQVLTTDGSGNTSWTAKTTGASGTFVSQDGKTVTVTNGLITSIV